MRKTTITALLSFIAFASMAASSPEASADKNKWVAGGLNFFFPGAGYAYNGEKPLYVTAPMIAGSIGLAYVEQVHEFEDGQTLKDHDSTAFGVMFVAIFFANTGFAIDAYQEAGRINRREKAMGVSKLRFDMAPIRSPAGGQGGMGLSLSGAF